MIYFATVQVFSMIFWKKNNSLHTNENCIKLSVEWLLLKDELVFTAKPPPRDAAIFEINNSFNMRRWKWTDRSIDNGQILFLPGCK